MFREMRRKGQALPVSVCEEILHRVTAGVLAVEGDGGYPYAVPLSFVYDAGKLYFHCAKEGHKLDAIRRNAKASFCVVDQDRVVPEKYTTYFRSVIAFGTVRVLEEAEEKRAAIEKLAAKYSPSQGDAARAAAIQSGWRPLCMLELTVQHLSGKQAIELV
ncbi:MAG: pyridoxamine 5'-phosphate oxidase family protein [Candidatus Howiella sp.]|jgi:nitroimidazol reductase NimA-like FMN-containing flavoprotein (pyridoxamine 5'-phosphate oxidase superfamily)